MYMFNKKIRKLGFSIIEVLIAIVIICILIFLAVTYFQRAKTASDQSDFIRSATNIRMNNSISEISSPDPTVGSPSASVNSTSSAQTTTSVGWVPSLTVDSDSGTYWGSESTCKNHSTTKVLVCVYTGNGADTNPNDDYYPIDLYYRVSNDGGATFADTKYKIAAEAGDEYDPFLEYDSNRNKLVLIYSQWYDSSGSKGNKVMARLGTPNVSNNTVSWSEPYNVASKAGSNYWDASVLHLQNGTLLAFLTVEGSEGNGYGYLEYRSSQDGGKTWSMPSNPVIGNTKDTCMDEEQPVATQNLDGPIRLLYRNRGVAANPALSGRCLNLGAGDADTWQIWSTDNGASWIGQAGFRQTEGPDLFSYVGTEGGENQTVLMILKNSDGTYSPYHMQSSNRGLTFEGPYLTAESSYKWNHWENIDPHFTVGCRGFVANFTSAVSEKHDYLSQIYVRAFNNGTNTCSQ